MTTRITDVHAQQLEIARKELRGEAERRRHENQADDSIVRQWREFDIAYARVTRLRLDPNASEQERLREWTRAWLELARVVDPVLGSRVVDLKGEDERPGVRVTSHLFEIARKAPSLKRFEKELDAAWADLVAAGSTFDMTVYFGALRDTVRMLLNGELTGPIRGSVSPQKTAETTVDPTREPAREAPSSQVSSNPAPRTNASDTSLTASITKEDRHEFAEALTDFVRIVLQQEEKKTTPIDTGDPDFPAPQWIRLAAAADLLGLSHSTVHRWLEDHPEDLGDSRLGRRRTVVRREVFLQVVRDHRPDVDLTLIQPDA